MTEPPERPEPSLDPLVDAISDGADVPWEAAAGAPGADADTLDALRFIDQVARRHRGGTAPDDESIGAGATWGNLRLLGRIGGGTYGEVWRAFDPALQRDVALKLWTGGVQPQVIERLLGEARMLARIRHSNVLLVHGADVVDGRVGMWTELLEGETLEVLTRQHGSCQWREAALYGIELSRALAAAHAEGLVHRDVKPSNVMREKGGRIVLMDFGSAGAFGTIAPGWAGDLQGTPLAMAPEVLRGEPATPASDLYALGALLFRIVSGRHPVEAESLEDLRAELDRAPRLGLRDIRPGIPLAFAQAVERALERDPARRVGSAMAMEQLLRDALRSDWDEPGQPAPRHRIVGTIAAVAAGAALVALAGWAWLAAHPVVGGAQPMQFTLQLPAEEHLLHFSDVVVAPDGRTFAFAARDSDGVSALWVRRFDGVANVRLPGTEGATRPFWSADSRHLGFFDATGLLRVDPSGSGLKRLCDAELGRGGTWNRSGVIVFAPSTHGPLMRVSADGGTPVPATAIDTTAGEVSHRWPFFLPDGDHFLFVTTPAKDGAYALDVGSLHSERRAHVGDVHSAAVFGAGLLVYLFNETLEARRFDLRTLRWSGPPVPVQSAPGMSGSLGEPHASVSQTGTLVYGGLSGRDSRLVWVNVSNGAASPLAQGPYFDPRISPDGRRIALERSESTARSNVWMMDAESGLAERWTDDPGLNRSPVWSPGGDSIAFSTNRSGHYVLRVRSTRGALAELERRLVGRGILMWPNDWGSNGRMTCDVFEPGESYNTYEIVGGRPTPLACSPAAEMNATFSPDGRWIAFDSNASGRPQLYVVNRTTRERYVISHDGGMRGRWARGTGHLFFSTPAGLFMEVTPQPGRAPDLWPQRELFRRDAVESYDVDRAGRRILCCVKAENGRPEEVHVLANLPAAVQHGF
jgi:Tol biopolymer transport system component